MKSVTSTVSPGRRRGVPRVKVAVPRLPAQYLSRPRLLDALDAATGGQVTLVSAPAGFGKTQLLAEWAAQDPDRTAWVGLDDDDNDDVRFWSAVLDALECCPPVRANTPLLGLAAPAGAGTDPAFLVEVVDTVAAVPGTVRLVLDDVHEVRDARTLHGLAALVRDRPGNLQLVLAARSDPSLPLARMRLEGELCELRARDLAFTPAEAQAVLESACVPVRPDQARLIAEQTEGWPAGIWLAALSLRDAEEPDAFLSNLAGNSRAVSEYLVGEVLAALPGDVLDLLHAVSVCDRVCAALVEALAERPGAGEVLDRLERETSLLVSSGEGRLWYRVHPLLRAHLHADLVRLWPDRIPQLHARAARWYADVGQPEVALTHALCSDDPAQVALLLREHAIG